jgi:ATP-dependent protease ClpP protease subunit
MDKDIRERLLKSARKGIVPIFGGVDKEMLERVQVAFGEVGTSEHKRILVLISSEGGDGEVGLEIHDLLRALPVHKVGLVTGKAMSAASYILQACDYRLATPNSRLLIHYGKVSVPVEVLLDPDESPSRFINWQREMLRHKIAVYVRTTKRTEGEIVAQLEKDQRMFADEAKTFGLIDGIWDKVIPKDLNFGQG